MIRARTALESPTFAQKIFVPTNKTDTHVLPLNLKFIFESLNNVSLTELNDFISCSFTSVESTTL